MSRAALVLVFSLFFAGSCQVFAQADTNYPTLEELQYDIDQINGNLTKINEMISEIEEGKQCTVCEQEQQKEQNFYFNALLVISLVTASLSGLLLCLYFIKKFKLHDKIKSLKNAIADLESKIDSKTVNSGQINAIEKKIESLKDEIYDLETKFKEMKKSLEFSNRK